ncbi:MAG: LysM domain-containing protein [Dehalococcoidia bacterium]
MASPYISHQTHPRQPIERPWLGMALLIAVPLLALILVRMLWSGSGLWFLTVGIILLGIAAVMFLARRPQEREYGQPALAEEPNRVPLVLAGIGVVFLAMLLLPNFADSGSSNSSTTAVQEQQNGLSSGVAGVQQQQPQVQVQPTVAVQPTAAPVAQQPPASAAEDTTAPVVDGETYIVQDGDTISDIADRFGVTTDDILAANGLDNPDALQIGDELIIPAPAAGETE